MSSSATESFHFSKNTQTIITLKKQSPTENHVHHTGKVSRKTAPLSRSHLQPINEKLNLISPVRLYRSLNAQTCIPSTVYCWTWQQSHKENKIWKVYVKPKKGCTLRNCYMQPWYLYIPHPPLPFKSQYILSPAAEPQSNHHCLLKKMRLLLQLEAHQQTKDSLFQS